MYNENVIMVHLNISQDYGLSYCHQTIEEQAWLPFQKNIMGTVQKWQIKDWKMERKSCKDKNTIKTIHSVNLNESKKRVPWATFVLQK